MRTARRGPWVIAVAVLLVVALAVTLWLRGGFAPAAAGEGRSRPVGEAVPLTRWRVTVVSAELTDDEDGRKVAPRLVVRADVVNLGKESEARLPENLLVITGAPAGGDETPRVRSATGDRSMQLDPGVAEVLALVVSYEKKAQLTVPATVRVVLHDERYSVGFLVSDWVIGGAVAHVDVPVVDRRRHG